MLIVLSLVYALRPKKTHGCDIMDERIKFCWIQTSGTGRSNVQNCDECVGLVDVEKIKPLLGKVLCFDCREAYESILDDMENEQKMHEYFTSEEITGLR